jgi:hypothetical protein
VVSFIAICLLASSAAQAVEPTIRNINIRGLQIGGTSTITIDGEDLAPDLRLLLPLDIVKQELKPEATDKRAVFDVTLGDKVAPGMYNLRVTTAAGASVPVVIAADRMPQLPIAAEAGTLPVALHGAVGGSSVVETKFTGQAGQEVVVEVEAQRLGGKLRPVLHLYDSRRLQLAWSWPTPTLFGDTRLPADGVYIVALHDAEYAAPAPNHFRLKIGMWSYVDQVFPSAVERGKPTAIELLGNVSDGRIELTPPKLGRCVPVPSADAAASGLRPAVVISDTAELLEQPAGESPQQLPPAPVAVSGRLSAAGEEDRYTLSVTPGSKLKLEVQAERLGSPMDAVLILRNDQGAQLARGEDGPGTTDPVLEYTVPDKVTAIVVAVVDLHQRGGPRCVYRLVVESLTGDAQRGDFQLITASDRIRVSSSGRTVVPVVAERRGYSGPIRLAFDGPPSDVTVEGNEIPAGADGTLVTLATAAESITTSLITIRGESSEGAIARLAAIEDHPLGQLQPWLSSELAVSQTAPSNFIAEWGETPSEIQLVLAGKLPLPIKLTRPEGEATPVRLTLVTSQNVPKLNGKPDPNKAVRAEAAVEIAPDKNDGQLVALTPPDLAGEFYDLSLQAELLSKDKRQVLATAFTPVRRLNVVNPIGIQLAGDPKYKAEIDPKTGVTVKLTGKIERRAGFTGEATINLAGLPNGVKADAVTVKADTADYELAVVFPANFQASEVTGLKLSATAAPDEKQPKVLVRSNEIELTIAIVAAQQQP